MHETPGCQPLRGPCDRDRWRGPTPNSDPEQRDKCIAPLGEECWGQAHVVQGVEVTGMREIFPGSSFQDPSGLQERG